LTEELVSVVLPTHNRARWVGRAIASVLGQTHRAVELLVVDDGSEDETAEVVSRFGGRIRLLSQPRAGAYAARNLALRHVTGDLVAFIDSDDAWHPTRLARQLPLMARPEVGLVFGDAVLAPPRRLGPRTCFEITPPRRGRVLDHFAWGNFVPTSTVLVRRSCLEEVGGFPTSHDISADFLTWFRIAQRYELDYVSGPVADYTVHAGGVSNDLGRSLRARMELFGDELSHTHDAATRSALTRLVFNLGLHIGVAAARRRAHSVRRPWALMHQAFATAPPRDVPAWAAAFALRQLRLRGARMSPVR
jgi:glycosyltransferase involved in cell wall biosynthesis